MKRRYKLLLIILIGAILTIFINSLRVTSKTTLTSFGDGLSIGMTPYNVAGTSFNDYLKEKLETKDDLESYNNEFSYVHQTIHELNEHLNNNDYGKTTRTPIKQIIAKSDLLTLAIGVDEFASKSQVEEITSEIIDNYIDDMNIFLKNIREFYDKQIIVIGVYPALQFSKKDAVEVNSKLKVLCGKYDATFLDILATSLHEEYYLEKTSYYMNYLAHKDISKGLYLMYKKNN